MRPAHRAANTCARFVVAVTGGIASGKSIVTSCFQGLGVTVYDADIIARDLVAPGQPALDEIVTAFGPHILNPDGTLDRHQLRDSIFNDVAKRQKLQSILHPRIRKNLLAAVQTTEGSYCVLAIPLLVETYRDYDWVDRVLVIDVPESTQMQRLLERDGMTEELAHQILSNQASRSERLALADDVIENTGTLAALTQAVNALHQRYIALAREKQKPS